MFLLIAVSSKVGLEQQSIRGMHVRSISGKKRYIFDGFANAVRAAQLNVPLIFHLFGAGGASGAALGCAGFAAWSVAIVIPNRPIPVFFWHCTSAAISKQTRDQTVTMQLKIMWQDSFMQSGGGEGIFGGGSDI